LWADDERKFRRTAVNVSKDDSKAFDRYSEIAQFKRMLIDALEDEPLKTG